ncbi:hypothetical protein AHF37_07168 [Paragonimus kellicotti]|nr:hypothetical protein AHF37_07168 [Paragonimus kellicotti]
MLHVDDEKHSVMDYIRSFAWLFKSKEDQKNLVLIGPPGCGKGTQAIKLAARYHICHLSTGDMLRAVAASGSPLGTKVKDSLASGKLVSDDILEVLLQKRKQRLTAVIEFKIDDKILERRVSGRLYHQASGRTYHEIFRPPKLPMTDDLTGERLIRRPDDSIEVLRKRLTTYHELTYPLVDFYKIRKLHFPVNAMNTVDRVFTDIVKWLESDRRQ